MSQVIITAIGPDRPGLVGELSGQVHSAGGNILETRMVNLRGQFALMMLLEGDEHAIAKLAGELPGVAGKLGLKLSTSAQGAPAKAVEGVPYRLKTYSMDQPGIVHRVTDLLQGHGVNIEELSARQESAAFAGSPLFLMEMRLTVPGSVPVRKLRVELEALCDGLNCDVDLEPA